MVREQEQKTNKQNYNKAITQLKETGNEIMEYQDLVQQNCDNNQSNEISSFDMMMNNEFNRFNKMKLQKQRMAKALISQEQEKLNITKQRQMKEQKFHEIQMKREKEILKERKERKEHDEQKK